MSRRQSTNAGYELHPQLAANTHPLAALPLCELRLMDDSNYPWLVLVPRVAGARDMINLDDGQRHVLTDEIDISSRLLRNTFRPFKLNVAALGNLVPQLHVHVIARFEHDPAWPKPVWGMIAARPYAPDALVRLIRELQTALAP